jgi:RimJ/RimL family protein N-acetyltransferase
VAERCGFTVEGRLRSAHLRDDGTRADDWYGSLLATDEVRDRRAFGSWRDRAGHGLLLRRWRDDEADAAALVEGCADPETARWVPVPVPFTGETARWYLSQELPRQWAEGVAAPLAVEQDGRVVGGAVLMAPTARSAPEAGWWTMPADRGRGVATRAAGLLAEWAGELGHTRVEARVDTDNPASSRAAERAGYSREGVLRGSRPDRDGRPRDMVLHARLLPGRPVR